MAQSERDLSRPIEGVMIASSSPSKRAANEKSIGQVTALAGAKINVDSVDPEIYAQESESHLVDIVAWLKTETLRQHLRFNPDQRTLIVAFDVATFISEAEGGFNPTEAEDLKRVMRQIEISDDVEAQEQWQRIVDVIETEKVRMLERCTNGAFCIEWHVGFALNSSDGMVTNRGALVLRAVFSALDPQIIIDAFTLSEELETLRSEGILPQREQLVEGVQALAIGPRLPFAELLAEYAYENSLVAFNRDYPENKWPMNPDVFLALIRDCALPPQVGIQLLAGSLDPEMIPDKHLDKPTVKLNLGA